VFNRLVLS